MASGLKQCYRHHRRWVLRARSRRETESDALSSVTASDKEIARNPHRPEGFGGAAPSSVS